MHGDVGLRNSCVTPFPCNILTITSSFINKIPLLSPFRNTYRFVSLILYLSLLTFRESRQKEGAPALRLALHRRGRCVTFSIRFRKDGTSVNRWSPYIIIHYRACKDPRRDSYRPAQRFFMRPRYVSRQTRISSLRACLPQSRTAPITGSLHLPTQ